MHNTHPYFYGATERSQVSYDFISRSLIMRHGRDRGGGHDWCPPLQMRDVWTQTFCFCQKYRTLPQTSTEDWYPVLPSAASAADVFTDTSACVCGRVDAAVCWRVLVRPQRVCVRSQKRPCLHISAALSAPFLITQFTLPGERREGRGEQLAVTLVGA